MRTTEFIVSLVGTDVLGGPLWGIYKNQKPTGRGRRLDVPKTNKFPLAPNQPVGECLGAPEPPQMNFLSARGLGGAHALATAKASVPLAPTVYSCETIYFL